MDDIPWDRIVHFFGRATRVPALLRQVEATQEDDALATLRDWLTHQDGVIQATPFASFFLARAWARQGGAGLRRLLEALHATNEFALSSPCYTGLTQSLTATELLRQEWLWPAFVSESEDEMLWEEWDPSSSEQFSWCRLTKQVIEWHAPDITSTLNDREPKK